jgi:hypothetical protein
VRTFCVQRTYSVVFCRQARSPPPYPRGSVFLDGSSCTAHDASLELNAQGTASAAATKPNLYAAMRPAVANASSMKPAAAAEPPSAAPPPSVDALRLRAARAAAAAVARVAADKAAAAAATAPTQAAADTAVTVAAATAKAATGKAAAGTFTAGAAAARRASDHASRGHPSRGHSRGLDTAAHAPSGEPPVVVDDCESVSLSLRPGEKAVIPSGLRHR